MARKTAEEAARTRQAIVDAGRELWAARGFGAVGLDEIARGAGVTRGAAYHHFADKRALFAEVARQVERGFVETIAAPAVEAGGGLAGLLGASRAALSWATDDPAAGLVLREAAPVLGDRWREIVEEVSLPLLVSGLEAAMDAGELVRAPATPLAHLILGALDRAGVLAADGADPDELWPAIETLLRGLAREK